MGVEKGVEEPGTADVADDRHLISGQFHDLQGLVKALDYRFMTTARAKYRRPRAV
jgi:hypothetical protein